MGVVMQNKTKRELLLLLSLICFITGAVVFFLQIAFYWEPFWLQLKRYWVHIALAGFFGFLFLLVRKEIPKKSNIPKKITPGKLYAGKKLNRQRKSGW